jgi:oligoribonuclease NrnB/cAMP/cGMP phosphodiesterase (DHH superfamily)
MRKLTRSKLFVYGLLLPDLSKIWNYTEKVHAKIYFNASLKSRKSQRTDKNKKTMRLIITLENAKLSELVVNEIRDKQQTVLRGKKLFLL